MTLRIEKPHILKLLIRSTRIYVYFHLTFASFRVISATSKDSVRVQSLQLQQNLLTKTFHLKIKSLKMRNLIAKRQRD